MQDIKKEVIKAQYESTVLLNLKILFRQIFLNGETKAKDNPIERLKRIWLRPQPLANLPKGEKQE